MADAKAAAGIVSAAIAAAVFLVGLYWRWDQRRRDREALLATLEQQYSEKVQPACAYLSALTRKYPGDQLWSVLLSGTPPNLQRCVPPGVAATASSNQPSQQPAASGEGGRHTSAAPTAAGRGSVDTNDIPVQVAVSEAYQVYQLTKASLDFMVAEEQARNMIKGFWIQLLGAMQRSDLPEAFGAARGPLTSAEWQRHPRNPRNQPSSQQWHQRRQQQVHGATDERPEQQQQQQQQQQQLPSPMPAPQHETQTLPLQTKPTQQQPLLTQATASGADAPPAGAAATPDVELGADGPAAVSGVPAPAHSMPAPARASQPCILSLASMREHVISLRGHMPWPQLQPGNVRFTGMHAGLWTKRARNFLQLVEPFDIANYYRLNLHSSNRHYNDSRPEVFWRLDELCQHEARVAAQASGRAGFKYTFSRQWADHMQHAAASDAAPTPPAGALQELYVPVSAEGKWCEAVTATEAAAAGHLAEGCRPAA